jgi:hypothetical protein
MNNIQKTRLTGDAFRYLLLLKDFGHLDDEALSQVVLGFSPHAALSEQPELDRDSVRRAAAMLLFNGSHSQDPALLDADWPYVFS